MFFEAESSNNYCGLYNGFVWVNIVDFRARVYVYEFAWRKIKQKFCACMSSAFLRGFCVREQNLCKAANDKESVYRRFTIDF